MNTAEQRYEQIEQYLRGLMAAGEARAFEAEMNADPELAAQVRRHRLERQGLELLVERDLYAKMQAWDREGLVQQPAPARKGGMRPVQLFWRAAAVLILAALGWWLLRDNPSDTAAPTPTIVQTQPDKKTKTPSARKPAPSTPKPVSPEAKTRAAEDEPSEDIAAPAPSTPKPTPAPVEELPESEDYAALADEFYQERAFLPPSNSRSTGGGSALDRARKNFQDGKYTDVITQLEPSKTSGVDALQQKELIAHALYKNGQWEQAATAFREIVASRKQPYAQRAEWALALTLLHQMPAKKPLFDRVMKDINDNPQHLFFLQARALREKLQ